VDERYPQSLQSVPRPHVEANEPGPPSSQIPLLTRDTDADPVEVDSAQVFSQDQLLAGPSTALVPSHAVAALGHWLHDARVFELPPPDVNHPGRHVLQLFAPPNEYALSSPHAVHLLLLAGLYLPAGHDMTTLDPEHVDPASQAVHIVRVALDLPPDVKKPGPQFEHVTAPSFE
jgi:hypothetical protein